jgi:hypothetical protein
MRYHWLVALSFTTLVGTTGASAQVDPMEWHKGTALSVFGGAASVTGGSDGALGAAIGWELTPRFTFEGSGLWTIGDHVDAFTALAGTRVNLLPPRGVLPFLSAGAGVHRTTRTELGRERGDDDFVVALGGGVDIYLKRHLALRPDVRVLLVNRDSGGTGTVTVYGVHLAYHFEEHPITP